MGSASRIREQLILDALDAQLQAEEMDRSALLTATIVGGARIEGGARKKILSDMTLSQERAELLRMGDFDGVIWHRFENSSLAAETVHGIVSEAGLLGDRSHEDDDPYDEDEP